VHIKDSCWSVGIIYDSRELSGVSTTGPGVVGVLQVVSELTLTVSRTCVGQGLRYMAHGACGPGVATWHDI
jgi:hypothetical protein